MKFPSLASLYQAAIQAFIRFPLSVLFALAASVNVLIINHQERYLPEIRSQPERWAMACFLGMILALAVSLFNERRDYPRRIRIFAQLAVLAVAIAYYFQLNTPPSPTDWMRFRLFSIGLHALVAFAPFFQKGEINGFWQYNRILFLRLLTAFFYSVVLFAGLSLALLATEKLFGVDIGYKWYADLWVALTGVMGTIYFLSGIPAPLDVLEGDSSYPRGLRIFTQFILLPIIGVYLLILYSYSVKILVSGQWPYGWVSYLVLCLSVGGILSVLLIYPLRKDQSYGWVRSYSRFFFLALSPLIVLLFFAISRRIRQYGFTEERYLDFVLACWLAVIALYFLFSRAKNIKIIPASLCLLAFLTSGGPWGAFSVALHSQMGRLNQLFQKNGMIRQGKAIPAVHSLSEADAAQIGSIMEYVVHNHGHAKLQPLFTQNLDSLFNQDHQNYYSSGVEISSLMNQLKIESGHNVQASFNFSLADDQQRSMPIAGYDLFLPRLKFSSYNSDTLESFLLGGRECRIRRVEPSGNLRLELGADSAVLVDLCGLVGRLKADRGDYNTAAQDSLSIYLVGKGFRYRFLLQQIRGLTTGEGIRVSEVEASLLIASDSTHSPK